MKLWILVHAVIHNANSVDGIREKIYKCLSDKKWIKIKDHHISTLWKGVLNEAKDYTEAFDVAKKNFTECARSQGKTINMVVQVGPNEPKEY